jgi:hypothetical protein
MAKTTQITVSAESRPGVLAKVLDTLAKAGINIRAVCAAEAAGRGKIRLVVSDPARARQALVAAKIRCAEEPALVLSMEARPGALAAVAAKLAAARINIKCAYASPSGAGTAQVGLAVANPDKAEQAIG